uniref:Uncharacterized protein n=1 Tax=Oryza brachyantha TaxID=4533 RepID=J3KWE6_ORYBR
MMVKVVVARRGGEASNIPTVLGALGLVTASLIINLMAGVYDPPLGFGDSIYYHLALVGSFLAGMAQVGAAVWVADDPHGRREAGYKFIYASIAPFLVAVGLTYGGGAATRNLPIIMLVKTTSYQVMGVVQKSEHFLSIGFTSNEEPNSVCLVDGPCHRTCASGL